MTTVYLDIETDPWAPWDEILVIGLFTSVGGYKQLTGRQITSRTLRRWLPGQGRLVTFNGDRFDLRVIRTLLGLELTDWLESHDLRHLCRNRGLAGGQKSIEEQLGWIRAVPPLDIRQQRHLWAKYKKTKDSTALGRLLRYNRDDLLGMRQIRRALNPKWRG